MKRLMLGIAVTSALGLTACDGESVDQITEGTLPLVPQSQMVYDPAAGLLPLPNDLLFNGTSDGTLNIPGEEGGDYTNPEYALGALDGWSTVAPISLTVTLPNDTEGNQLSIMESSVLQPGAVRMFEATVGGALSSDSECTAEASVSACKVGEELTFGVDFVTAVSGNSIVIVPLKPLKAKQSYIYVTTDLVQDSTGRAIAPSTSYALLKLDITTHPLETPDQLFLQTLVNSYEKKLAEAHGIDPMSISSANLFTTQSVGDVYETTKLLMVQPATEAGPNPYAPSLVTPPMPTGKTVADELNIPAAHPSYAGYAIADVYSAQFKLPVYSPCSSIGCLEGDRLLLNDNWSAHFDSPVAVLLAIEAGTLSIANFAAQAEAYNIDPAAAQQNPALLAGKAWVLDDGTAVDKTKHLTQYNPIPRIVGYETVDALITIPNHIDKPVTGWPTTMVMHGLGGVKETALATAGAYAVGGVATIAIDMPLHGKRSFGANAEGVYAVSATDPSAGPEYANGDPLVFVNIASTLAVRDNFRQAILDHLAVRAVVTGFSMASAQAGAPVLFDATKVTAQGLSLGAIVDTTFSTYANTGLVNPANGEPLPNPYGLVGTSLVAPAGGLAGTFAGSPTFAPVLKATILATEDFQALVKEANTAGFAEGTPEYTALVDGVYASFLNSFAFAVQTAIDSADPINHGAALAATALPVHLIEIVGDGGASLPDQVLPNTVAGFPLSVLNH